MPPLVRRVLRLAAPALALAILAASAPAWAHAVLLGSDPPADAALAQAPSEVTLTFNEPVAPVRMRLVDRETGAVVAELAPATDGAGRVTASLPPLSDGRWLISWRVVSDDSHPVGGSLAFDVGAVAGDLAPAGADAAAARLVVLAGAGRAVFLTLLLAAAGGALALALLAPRLGRAESARARRTVAALAIACAPAALASVALQGALVEGGFAGETRVPEGLATPLGRATLLAGGLAGAVALLLRLETRGGAAARIMSAALGCGALATLAAAGHAATAPPRAIATAAVAAHALAGGLWLGGLVVLAAAMRLASNGDLAHLLAAFSRRALPAVALLAAAGLGLAALQSRDPAALAETAWGRILLVKLALVAVALALAAQNKARLTRAIARADSGARRRLARNVRAEIGLLAGVLALTAALGQTSPPRAHAGVAAIPAPLVLSAHDHRHRTAALTITSLPDGRIGLAATLTDARGQPVPLREAVLAASLPEAGIEPLARAMRVDAGVARLETRDLAAPGAWRLELRLLIDDFDAARVGFDARLP